MVFTRSGASSAQLLPEASTLASPQGVPLLHTAYIYGTESGDRIGEGAFSVVYIGVHKKSGEKHALKFVNATCDSVSREWQALRAVKHDNIVSLYGLQRVESAAVLPATLTFFRGFPGWPFPSFILPCAYSSRKNLSVLLSC